MNNEPAFPTPAHNLTNDGMTIRDYFAAKAMQGVLANPDFDMGALQSDVAQAAYNMADAMMKSRGES